MKLDSTISAVITGGASGLGAASARRLAQHGVKVALFDLNEAAGEALAKELGGVFCLVDVTKEESVDAGFAKARAAIGQERILVNCAGTGNAIKTASRDRKTGEIRHFPLADFDRLPASPQSLAMVAIIGVVHTGAMYAFLYSAIQKLPVVLTGTLSFLYPVVAIAVDMLAYGHVLTPGQAAGGAAILLAAVATTLNLSPTTFVPFKRKA